MDAEGRISAEERDILVTEPDHQTLFCKLQVLPRPAMVCEGEASSDTFQEAVCSQGSLRQDERSSCTEKKEQSNICA